MENHFKYKTLFALFTFSMMTLLIASPTYSQNTSDSFEIISTSNLERLEPIISWKPDGQLQSKGIHITPAKNSNFALIENRLQNLLGIIDLDKQILDPIYKFNTDRAINRTAISPNGQFAAVQDYTSFDVWATETGKQIIHGQALEADSEVSDLRFSPKSDMFANVVNAYPNKSSEDAIYLYDLSTGKQIKKLVQPTAQQADFSPDSVHLISAGYDGSVYLWDLQTDQFTQIRMPDGKSPTQLNFVTPELFVMTLFDSNGHYLEYWNIQTKHRILLSKEQEASDFRNDGISQIRLPDRVSFKLWSIFQEKELATLNNVGIIEDIDPQNNIVTTGGINFFQLDTGDLLRTISIPNINTAVFSYDSKYVIFSGIDVSIQVWGVRKA